METSRVFKILGWQKVSLLDYPEKISTLLFTAGCNFHCPFCHNPQLVHSTPTLPAVDLNELFLYLKRRQGKLDGLCLSGGEPLLQPEIELFFQQVKELGYLIKLDTNGSFPDRLETLLRAKLVDYVAMDIKNSPSRYAMTVGRETVDLSAIQRSINIVMSHALDYEFRTTLVKEFHTSSEVIHQMGKMIQGARRWALQQFYDTGNLLSSIPMHPHTSEELNLFCEIAREYADEVILRDGGDQSN